MSCVAEKNAMQKAAAAVVHGLATLWVDGPLRRYPILGNQRTIDDLAMRIVSVSTQQLRTP